jgi:hypothetical protein
MQPVTGIAVASGGVSQAHVDYLHDGRLHHMHGDHVDEHAFSVSATNPVQCTPQTRCSHKHGPGCGHEGVTAC